jgi:serine/threonine protein kinase
VSAETLPTDRLIGEVLASRYQILHRLGEGAMGAVYKARHVKVGRFFAVKVLHARVIEDAKVLKRFEREAELAGRLRHANVVGVVDVGEIDGMRYMVMDFAEGPDLAELLEEAPMPPLRIIHLVRQLLEGLYHAHEQGLIHRDFKPENVIVERDAHDAELPRIVDFGIAILRDGGAGVDTNGRLTTNGLVLGTPHYMAPEQAVADPIDHRIDLFALGIVVYEMLSGRLPFDGNGAEVARANLLLDPPPIVQRVPYLEVDPLLEAFARRLMAKKRDARPATAKAARELLDLIERDRPAAAVALGLPASISMRAPAITEPVPPQASGPMSPGPRAALWGNEAATTSLRSPGVEGPLRYEPPPQALPVAYSPPRGPIDPGARDQDPRAPVAQQEIETSRRIPLSWQSLAAPRRRAPWLVGGAAMGVVGIALAAMLARTTADEPAEAVADRLVMTSISPGGPAKPSPIEPAPVQQQLPPAPTEPTTQPSPAIETVPTTTAPVPTTPADTADPTLAVPVAVPAPAEANPRKPARVAKSAESKEARTAPPRTPTKISEARTGEARTGETRASDGKPDGRIDAKPDGRTDAKNDAKPDGRIDAKPDGKNDARSEPKTDAKTTAKPPKVVGLTANELSHFYAAVGRELSALPSASVQDLWSRLLLIKIQELMGAPQERRDQAAKQLLQIQQEAARRKP